MNLSELTAKLQNRTPVILGSETLAKYAVLVPLIEKEDGIHVLFEVRSLQMRRQPGEVCFPGGRVDPSDEDEAFAAIRETSEELGLKKESIHSIAPLDYMISPFGMVVYPYAGVIAAPAEIVLNEAEVEEVFSVPLSLLLNYEPEVFYVHYKVEPEPDFPFTLIAGGENYQWQTRKLPEYFFRFGDKVIWGLTARILHHFIRLLTGSKPPASL